MENIQNCNYSFHCGSALLVHSLCYRTREPFGCHFKHSPFDHTMKWPNVGITIFDVAVSYFLPLAEKNYKHTCDLPCLNPY